MLEAILHHFTVRQINGLVGKGQDAAGSDKVTLKQSIVSGKLR